MKLYDRIHADLIHRCARSPGTRSPHCWGLLLLAPRDEEKSGEERVGGGAMKTSTQEGPGGSLRRGLSAWGLDIQLTCRHHRSTRQKAHMNVVDEVDEVDEVVDHARQAL